MPRVRPAIARLLLVAALIQVSAARGLRPKMFIARAALPAAAAGAPLAPGGGRRAKPEGSTRGGRKAALATSADAADLNDARVALILEDGSVFEGKSFGAEPPAGGTFAGRLPDRQVGYAGSRTRRTAASRSR